MASETNFSLEKSAGIHIGMSSENCQINKIQIPVFMSG